MWRRFLLSIVVSLVCLFSVNAQTNLHLNETETQVVLQSDRAEFSLVLEHTQNSFSGKFLLELLDVNDNVLATKNETVKIKGGQGIYKVSLPLSDLKDKSMDKIAWFRLR